MLVAILVVLGTLVPIVWAQTDSQPTRSIGESYTELTLILVGIVVLVLVAGGKAIDRKRKREDQAVRLQAQISDALLRERRLASLPVAATVHIPTWWRSPARIELRGQVPTADLRQAVRRIAEQEASRSLPAFHIDDRLAVVLSMRARAA
jgi:cytochrome c biogenesis factor